MGFILVVVRPFSGHATGDRISDPAEVETVLAGEHAGCVVRTVAQGQGMAATPAAATVAKGG